MSHIRVFTRLVLALTLSSRLFASEAPASVPSDLILERFSIRGADGLLLIPVSIDGTERMFLVDTGCTISLFDSRLPVGKFRRFQKSRASGGEVQLAIHDAPDFSIGNLPFRPIGPPFGLGPGQVASVDLSRFRETGVPSLEGCLGIDFLGQHIMQVDFDQNQLLFLKDVPENTGVCLPMARSATGCPAIECGIGLGRRVWFNLDTGCWQFGSISWNTVRNLTADRHLDSVGFTTSLGLAGARVETQYESGPLRVGPSLVLNRSRFEESQTDVLGVGFLSHFVATFDFPGRKLYLRKGANYDRPGSGIVTRTPLRLEGLLPVASQILMGAAVRNR